MRRTYYTLTLLSISLSFSPQTPTFQCQVHAQRPAASDSEFYKKKTIQFESNYGIVAGAVEF